MTKDSHRDSVERQFYYCLIQKASTLEPGWSIGGVQMGNTLPIRGFIPIHFGYKQLLQLLIPLGGLYID